MSESGLVTPSEREVTFLRRLRDLSHLLARERDVQRLLPLVLDAAIELVGAERGYLVRVQGRRPSGGLKIKVMVARGFDGAALQGKEGDVSRTVVRRVLERGERGLVTTSEEDRDVMNVSSVGAYIPSPYMATYTATKAFVTAFSEGLMGEVRGTGVSVLCVCPGFTRTEFQDHIDQAVAERAPAMMWMSAEDVADEAVRRATSGGVLVSGAMNRATTAVIRHLPRGLVTWAAGALLKPPGLR